MADLGKTLPDLVLIKVESCVLTLVGPSYLSKNYLFQSSVPITDQVKASDSALFLRGRDGLARYLLSDDNTRPDDAPCDRFGLLLRGRGEEVCRRLFCRLDVISGCDTFLDGKDSLVTVEPTFRRNGGGEMARVGEALLLAAPSAILTARASENVVEISWVNLDVCWLIRSVFAVSCSCIRDMVGRAETREESRSHMFVNT